MTTEIPEKRTIVIKNSISQEEAEEIVNKKKTGLFGSLFTRPKPEEVQIESLDLFYEPYWIVGGNYMVDYYRGTTYTISVEPDVKEVKISDGVFPVRSSSNTWKKISSGLKAGVGGENNKVDIQAEEHVELQVEEEISLDRHGHEIKFDYKIDSKTMENFPDRILNQYKENIRTSEVQLEDAVNKLEQVLKKDMRDEVKIVKQKMSVDKVDEVYVPVYEARCLGPKNKVDIIRLDAVKAKIY